MHEDPLQVLDLRLGIALGCLRATTVRCFAGRGRSRRRELHLIPSMAGELADSLSKTLVFSRDGIAVIRSRVARHIADALHDVPDATARDEARLAVGQILARLLAERYSLTLSTRPVIVPAANLWCGLKKGRDGMTSETPNVGKIACDRPMFNWELRIASYPQANGQCKRMAGPSILHSQGRALGAEKANLCTLLD